MFFMVSYCLTFLWFIPLYEFAYVQCAIGCSFLRLRRAWLFPTIFGLGLLGIIFTYSMQDKINWILPPEGRADWYWILLIIFFLSWLIQKYAIGAFEQERERLLRYSIIGQETTRLTHDIKGLLSSPILIIESLQADGHMGHMDRKELENQIKFLAEDMSHVRDAIKSINNLVKIDNKIMPVDVREIVSGVLKVFSRRVDYIKVKIPESKFISANNSILYSVFFNIILNSIEGLELSKTPDPFIYMVWSGNTLIINDNIKTESDNPKKKSHGSGIGLEMVRSDLQSIKARFDINYSPVGTIIKIHF